MSLIDDQLAQRDRADNDPHLQSICPVCSMAMRAHEYIDVVECYEQRIATLTAAKDAAEARVAVLEKVREAAMKARNEGSKATEANNAVLTYDTWFELDKALTAAGFPGAGQEKMTHNQESNL